MLNTIGQLLLNLDIGLIVYEDDKLFYSNEAPILIDYKEGRGGDLYVQRRSLNNKKVLLISKDVLLYKDLKVLMEGGGNQLYKVDSEGNPIDIVIHTEDAQVLRGGVAQVLRAREGSGNIKYRLLQEGRWKWYSNFLIPIARGRVLGLGLDLSGILAHSKRVRKLQNILENLYRHLPIQIYMVDVSETIYLWEGKQLFLSQDVIGMGYKEGLKGYPIIVRELEKALQGAEGWWEIDYNGKHLESRAAPTYQDGELTGVLGVITDNTEIFQRAEELKQFAYIASHDLQEPVRMIHNYLQLLNHYFGEDTDPKAKKYIDNILSSANKLKNLIEDLLSYSRVSTKQEIKKVSLREVILEVLDHLSVFAQERGANIKHPDYTLYIMADRTHIMQLFQNLIQNAIKFSEGEPIVEIDWEREGDWVNIKVKDNGIGIDKSHHEYIFKPFKRLNNQVKGTGMGLSICKKVVEISGGSIEIESVVGDGATFHIRLRAAV